MISNSLFEYYKSYTEIGQRKDDQFFFNCSDKEFIGFYRYVAIWTNDQEKYRLRPNKTSLKLAINYLLSNSYFILGNMRYRKLTGILMGSDLPPFYGKGIFMLLQNEVDSPEKKQDMQEDCSNTFTFKDDLCTFSNDDFENNYNDIYPYLLNPEKVNKDLCKSSFFFLFWIFQLKSIIENL